MNLGSIAKYAVEVGNRLYQVVKALIALRMVDLKLGDKTAPGIDHHRPALKFRFIVGELLKIIQRFKKLEGKPKVVKSEPEVVHSEEPDFVGCLYRHRDHQHPVDRHYALTLLGIANKIINEHKLNSVRLISRGL